MSVSNITNGIKQVAFATHQSVKLDENISTLFGAKFLSSLIEFSFTIDESNVKLATASYGTGEIGEDDKMDESFHGEEVRTDEENLGELLVDHNVTSSSEFNASVRGFISKVGVGVGRSDNDRQFVFCNGRPVDMPKVAKALNEVWRKYEMKNKPAFIIDLKVSAGNFDVNLAPDKREVVIRHEFMIIDKMKEVVDQLYSPSRHTFSIGKPVPISSFLVSAVDKHESFENSTNQSDSPFVASTINHDPVMGEITHTVRMPEMNNNAMLKYPKEISICSSNAPPASPSLLIDKIKGDVVWISPLEKERLHVVNDSEPCDLQPVGIHLENYLSDSATMNEVDRKKGDETCDYGRDEATNSTGISEEVDGQQFLWKNKINPIKTSDSYFVGRKRKLQLLHGISENIATIDRMDSSKSAEFDAIEKIETVDSKLDAEHFKTLSKSVSSSFIFQLIILIILFAESFYSRILVE